MAIAEKEWARVIDLLTGSSDVALACHVEPDGDALGSMLAFQRFLQQRAIRAVASFGSSGPAHEPLLVPPQYTFLPGLDGLVTAAEFPTAPALLVAFDTGSLQRLGTLQVAAENAEHVIVIDHHARGEAFGDVRLCDGSAAATAVLVEELIRRAGGTLDREMATCLYVGVVTDTGRFQYASTTPAVMELGARLIGFDIDHAAINRQVWSAHSFGYLKLLGRAMDRAVIVPEAGLAWTVLHQSDLRELGVTMPETEGIIDVLHSLEAAECAMVLKEQPGRPNRPQRWQTSLRSKGDVDVGHIATHLAGGGHRFAAGFASDGSMESVVDRVVAALGASPLRWAG